MSQHAWLADLHIGDQVIVCEHASQKIAQVTRLTTTQILIDDTALRFRRKDGWQPGRDYHRAFLVPYTPEAAEAIHKKRLRQATYAVVSTIHRQEVDRLTDEQCQSILTLMHSLNLA